MDQIQEMIVISLLSFLSAMVTSILGFGAGLVLTPLLTFIMPLREALGIGALVYLVTAASKTYWFRADIDQTLWKRCLPLSFLGLAVGMLTVQIMPERGLQIVFAALLLYFSLSAGLGKEGSTSRIPQQIYPFCAGIASILVHAAGVFYFRYCRMNGLDRVQTVATMAALHFTLNIGKAIFFTTSGMIAAQYTYQLIPAYLCAILGTRFGRYFLKDHVSEKMFTRGVSFLLSLLAIKIVWNAF
jgi:uncharacterized membrane protein YfcA